MSIADYMVQLHEALAHLYANPYVIVIFTIYLAIASFTDIRSLKIPDKLNGLFFIVRFLLIPILGFTFLDVVGAFICFIGLLIPAMVKMHKMGGDIKCATVVGLYAGIYLAPILLLMSCIYLAAFTAFGMLFGKKAGMLPFAPFFLLSHLTLLALYFII